MSHVLSLLLVTAAAAPNPGWESLPDLVATSWAAHGAAAWERRARGDEEAASRVPLGPSALTAEAQVGVRDQDQLVVAVDVPLATGARERAAWKARREVTDAGAAEARWSWGLAVVDAYEAWWVAASLAEDLSDYAADVDREVADLQRAVEEGTLAPLALDELRAEWVQVRVEALEMGVEADVARARLEGLVGELEHGASPPEPPPVGELDPWRGLGIAQRPDVGTAEASARSAHASAAAASTARWPTVSAGPMVARDAAGTMRQLAWVGVSVPLQAGTAPQRRASRAEAEALELELVTVRRRAEAALRAESLRWEGLRAQLAALDEDVVGPLAARRDRLEDALRDGLVTADRVVRARRDAHEAEHQRVAVLGALAASEIRAALLVGDEGGRP